MPFTGAHPAIFLPFLRHRKISATALIAGSVAPDFEYFLRMQTGNHISHSLPGIFLFDMPVGLALALIFHLLIRQPLLNNLPEFLRKRLIKVWTLDFLWYLRQHPFRFVICLIAGILSHIGWDSLTHNSILVRSLDIYQTIYLTIGKTNYPLFYVLQQFSTFGGLTLVAVYLMMMPQHQNQDAGQYDRRFWPLMIVCASVIFSIRFQMVGWKLDLGNAVVSAVSALMAGLLISCITASRAARGLRKTS